MTVEWEGEERPLPQLQPFLKSPDRAVRERAFRAAAAARTSRSTTRSPGCSTGCSSCASGRRRNAGFANFRDYIFPAKFRFDYTPGRLRALPRRDRGHGRAGGRAAHGQRRQRLGLDTLRPWDLAVDPYRAARRSPVRRRCDEFVGAARQVFDRVDPALGGQFQTMIDERLLDLDSRKGKAPGRLLRDAPLPRAAVHLHERRRPGGRCHDAAARGRPRVPRLRLARAAAHLAAPPRVRGGGAGLDVDGAAGRAASRAADGILPRPITGARGSSISRTSCSSLVHIASVDAFQTLDLHQREGADADARDAAWLRLRARFERGVDWSGPRARAGGALVPPAPHLHVPVLLHRVRHRPDRRAPGLAQQPARPGGRRGALPRGAGPRRGPRTAEIYRAAGASSASMPA